MQTLSRDQWPVLLALVALAASCLWFRNPGCVSPNALRHASAGVLSKTPRAELSPPMPAKTPRMRWSPPTSKPAGDPWQFDVFSPPEIRYDETRRQFFVTPKATLVERRANVAGTATSSNPRLVSVRRALFEIQLVGYVASEQGGSGFFENVHTGENYVAGSGDRLGASGFTLQNFKIDREQASGNEMIFEQEMARARVRDDQSGRVTDLCSRERTFVDTLVATIALKSAASETQDVREGDAIRSDGRRFKVARIQIEPAAIELVVETPDESDREHLMLSLAPPSTATTGGPTS